MHCGNRVRARFVNNLEEPSSIHGHGIRIDTANSVLPHARTCRRRYEDLAQGDSVPYGLADPPMCPAC
ncbi:hypothetical protein [Labrenzia aggregata]|uniref:Multicopper oxidase n=1 Tax=Roseibium aggregatum TaxID=187304 RepID=A0A926P378_9HYPH|nr:hypothetical protein [Roseibium aggregatum]